MSLTMRRHPVHAHGRIATGRKGMALPAAMFALVAASILAAGMLTFADLSAKAALNQERATRAVHVADAGVSHALSLLRGSLKTHSLTRILRGGDNFIPTADDSLFVNYGLPADDEIPLGGKAFQGHTYFVTVRDDPADGDANAATDLNGRVLVRCSVVTNEGATVEVTAILGATPFPAVAADGNLHFSGTPEIRGACGGAHSNGNLSAAGTNTSVQTQATATGSVTGTFKLPDGSAAPRVGGQPEIVIPDLVPMDHCVGADYRLTSTGIVMDVLTGMPAGMATGWTMAAGPPVLWSLNGAASMDGTFCVEGNAYVSGNTGTAAAPRKISIIATGSIQIAGNPYLTADHEDNILLLAGGDVWISGNPAAGAFSYQGLIYGGAQCRVAGNAAIFGQLLCANGLQPLGAIEHTVAHDMSGNFTLTFDCSANVFNKRRVLYWYPRIGA